jgi:homoserine dehydrogenase
VLHTLALENGLTLRFTSSAGGGIPWLYNLKRSVRCDDIYKVMGIMNGTTNFILDAMISDGRDFDEVLAEAQRLGYAEANPSADIDGLDTARKTAISSSIAFNTIIKEENVDIFSLRYIKKADIDYITSKLNKTVRYLGFGVKNENGAGAFVEPALLPSDALESNVRKNNNMISLFGRDVGRLSFFGQGAGKYPTGNALAQDVIDILNGSTELAFAPKAINVDNGTLERAYYVRTSADVNYDFFDSVEVIDGSKYIITKKITVSRMHAIAKEIRSLDADAFFAGIED